MRAIQSASWKSSALSSSCSTEMSEWLGAPARRRVSVLSGARARSDGSISVKELGDVMKELNQVTGALADSVSLTRPAYRAGVR